MNVATDEILATLQAKFNVSLAHDIMEFPCTCINLYPQETFTAAPPISDPVVGDVSASDTIDVTMANPAPERQVLYIDVGDQSPEITLPEPEPEPEPIEVPVVATPEQPTASYVCDVSIFTLGLYSSVPVIADYSSPKSFLYVNDLKCEGGMASFTLNGNFFRLSSINSAYNDSTAANAPTAYNAEDFVIRIVISPLPKNDTQPRVQYDLNVALIDAGSGVPELRLGSDLYSVVVQNLYDYDQVSEE